MATETYIPEFVSISKGEGEEKNLRYMQLDATADENYPGELKKAEGALNDPSENFEYSEKTENMQVANIGIETVSTVNKGHEGTSEGESFLESPSVFKVAQLPISMHKGNDPEAEEKEHESDEGKKIPSDGTRDVTMTTVAASTAETTLQEAGVTFKEKSQDTIVLHEKVKDVILVEGEIQDQNKLDTPFVGQIKDLGLLEVDKLETLKEESESGTDMKEIPDEKNLPQVDLNEKIESEDAEILNKNSNELLVSYPSVEAVQVEGDKPDDISEVEPQEQVHETNGVPLEEKKDFEVATEAYKSTESLILEPTSIEGEKASNTYAEAIDYGLDTEKESKEKNVGQSIEEEIQKKEEACDPEIQKSATRSIDAEESKMDEDVSAKVSDTTGTGNETIQKSFQGDYLDEAPSALTSEGKSDKAKDDAEKDNITSEEVHDEIKITGTMEGTRELIAGEGDVIERLPESIREEKVKSFQDNEKILLADEKSRGQDNKEQTIADDVKGTPESIKEQNFTDNKNEDEKCREEIFVSSEKEKILDTSTVKPKESLLGEGENQVPIDSSTEEKRDEHRYSVMDEDNDDKTGLVEVQYDVKDETTIVKENTGWISQKDETGEKLEQSFTVMSKVTETVNSSEYTEKITRIEEERAIQDIEETFDKEEKKDTKNSEERGTASEEDLKPVAVASEINKSTESADLELKSEKGEMEVEKLERGNDLGSEERFKGNDAREEIEEETKKEETYQADLHKVETTCDDTEKSKIEEDALIKDASTVWIEEERVELSCQEDEDGRNGQGKAALELNDGDHNVRTDNETESSTDPIISEEIAAISQGTVKHIIKEEQNTIDISPQSSGEETHRSSQEDETKEEEPKTEMCEGETTTVGEGAEGQILEGDTIQDHSTVPTEVEETEDFSKYNEMMAEMPKPEDGVEDIQKDNFDISVQEETNKKGSLVEEKEKEPDREVCETISASQYCSTEFIEKDTESPQEDEVCKESEVALTSMEAEKQEIEILAIPDLSFSTFGGEMVKERSAQEFDGSIKECADVEQVAVELETKAQCIGSEASDTKTNCGPTEENKTSVDPGEKLEGAPESVAKDQSNETFLEMNQTQDAETSNNVQDQKSESVVEEQNIEQGLQEDEKNKYEETASGSEASDHVIQNENETISERAVDFSHSISEVSEEISKPIIQEAETCCNKLDTASKKVETEATCSWEAQPDEKPLKGTESTSEEKTITTGETSLQGEEGQSMKLEEATEFMSKLPAIPGENADKESTTMEKSHVDEVEETKGDSETVSESKEQCVEEIDGTQKGLTVEESEGIIKEEIKGPSETVSGCNYQVVESVIEDEINVVQTATTGESKEQHQEISKAPLPKEQDEGIIATISNLEDGKVEEGETTQKENLEDSFATRTSEEICLHKEEPRELESGLGIKLDEKIQNINPDEPPKEECITLDGVSQLEPQENVSAIKCSDSPTESDKVIELSEEVLEEAEKAAEESEDIKEQITEKDTDVKECLTVSPGDELVNKVQHSETIFDENSRATDSKVQIEQVNQEVMEDLSKDHEGSSITKAMEEEMLQKQGSERQVDVSSFVSEISEGINKEVIEDTDICSNNIDTASEKVETEDTRLQEIQLDDKHIKTIETGSDDKTLQTNTTPETSPQSEAVDSVKPEETPEGMSQCPVIACENTDKESEIVEKPHIDDAEEIKGADVEEIKGASESVSESIEQHVEGNDEIQKNLIVEESEEGIIKEEIKGSPKTGSRCSYQGEKVVIEDDVVHTATEEQHQETSKALLSEEQDHGITTTTGHLEDRKAEGGETPQNEDLEDSFATGSTEEICLQKEEPRKLEIFGLGLELNENIQNVNPNEPQKEECITLNEVSQIEPQENISTIKCSDSPTESDKVPEMPAEVPEGAEKAAEESENIKELIIEKERDIKECPAVSNEDESVRKAQYSETLSDDNPRATDSEVQTEKMNQEVVEDFSNDSEESPATKAMEEEILQKQGSGKKVDLYSCVSEISEAINKVVIDDADTCSNNSDTASQKVETEETRLWEAQMDDKHIKIIETSSEDEILQTNIAIETSPLGEEVENIKHEEAPEGVSQLPAVTCENTDDSETVEKPLADEAEEVKGASEIVSESREQFSEENDGILKSLTVEESESIIKEEIRGSSETVSGCNYEGVEAVVEDEMDVSETATTRKSEEQHQETSRALLSAEQDCGIIATIGCSEDGKTEEVGTTQNENLEDSKITEETCLQKEEPRDLEISEVGIELRENIQNINPNEPPKEECVTLDEVSQLEPQENVSAIKCSDSPTKSDKVMEFSEEALEVEKATEESEDIKKLIIEKERNVKECPAISIGDESVNKVLPSEIVSDENARSTDYEVQAEKVNLQVVEDFSKDPEGSPVTKAMEEEMLRMQGSEKKIDISSSVSEISEEINKEVVDACSYDIDTASEKVETEDTSLREAQLNGQHIEIIETGSETMQLQRNITTETSPHGEEVDRLKHEETPEVLSQLPAIAYENKDESEPVEKPHTDEVEEVKEASSTVYECKERCVEEIDETQKSQIVEGSEKGIIKEEIKGPSETVSVCNYEGVDVVIEDEIKVVQAATTGKSEESHHETSTVLLFEERDHGITTTTGHSEDGIAKEDGKIEKASAVVFEAHGNVTEKTAVELEAGAYSHGNEASSLKTIDSLTEEALEEAAESENIKKLIIEKEAESEEPAIEDESANKVQHSDTVPSENLGATDPNIQTEKANLDVVEDFSQELEGTPIEKALEEGKPQIQGSEKTVDISNFVSEISAETAKEVVEDTDASHDKLDTAYEKAETEETSLQEAQLKDKHIKIIETSSEDMKLQTNTTIETSPQGEEVDSVKLEETSTLVSQLPAIACENANKESEAVEKPARDEVEETKGVSDIESVSKEEWVEVIDETQKNPTVEESKDLFIEEIKGPSETVSQSKYQGVEAITEEKNIAVETAIAGKSEKQHQETSDSLLYEEQDHGISITVGYSEDGKTKEDETLQNENLEDSFATKKADYMHLQMEEHRELEISGLGLELNENLQKNNRNEPQKEGCVTIDEVSPLDAQENVSSVKCTNSPVESDKVMELTKEVPEEAEKAVEREKIKELIIDKDREIKELPAVSIDESVNKVQVQEPVSSEILGVTNPNMQTENLILEVEDLSKEPEGSPITKALEEEVSEKQNDQKAMDVHSSVSEMKENIKEEIVEKADISYCKLDTESEKGETEESSLQEAQLDDKPLEIIETSSEDKILQTNNTTETSQQTEEVDCMKLEETLELVSQLPPNGCESTNKEGETVEKPNADELEETAGASDKVPRSKEQCAEEIDENQKSLALEKSDEDTIKEQIERAFEMESELKYQGAEAVIEEEIIAGQAIKAEVPEEQLEEVSTAILSEEQEHGIHTTIGKSEDENIKEGETGQYENPEYSFGTKMSEEICLQEEEPRELDVSGPKEDGIIVDGVSQYELQENASELKCIDSPLGSEKVMEQISPIGSTHQEATKDDENDSGVVNNNPDVLTHSPGEEISQEEGEKCEEASNLECEHYEKASEPVSDLESAAIDEAVVGLEVGAHIHGSDASNTKNSENLREEVPQGADEAVESENIKELIIETERDKKDLPAVAIEDGTDNKAQHAEAVSNKNLTAIDSNTEAEIMNSVVAEYLSKDPEGSPVSEALQEEISQKQASEKTVEVTISVSEMPEESFNEETIKEANSCCSNLAPEKVVTEETSLQEGQLDDKPLRGLDTSAAEKTLSTNTTTECSLQDEEVDSMKVEETSELMSRLPTLACESADKEGKTVIRPHADVVEEPRGTSDTVSESREQCVENFVEIQESLTLEDNIVKEEIKGPADGVSECTNQSFEAAIENEVTADQTIEAEKPEEQFQEMSAALVSEEQEHGISTITTKLEDENTVENETPQYENPQDSFGTKMTEERCLHKEESRDLEVYELELNNDVQKKTSSEEPKEGCNALYRMTPLEPLEDAFEIKCTDSLAESNMELTRSMDSNLQEASNDDEDLDSGISIKNVNGVPPHCSSGEEILAEVDENNEEATNLEGEEGKEIEKVSESTFQVHSAEVDKVAIELEAGSHSHGSEPSSVENNNNPTEKNIELAELGEKLGGGAELVAEDQCTETLLETNQTQVNGNRSAYEQYTKSIEEQLTGHKEHETETMEETEGKLEFRDHINVVQNEDVTTKDVISVEEVPKEAEIAEEKENIQEQIIEEKIDTKELAAVSIEDKTVVDKVQHSEPVSCESYRATESNKETKEVNLEDEEDPCEKQADVSSSVFELSEKGFKGEILDEADNDNKLDTACKKEEAEKTIFQEPQLDDEPLKGTEAILEEKIPSIITTETSPGVEEAEAVKLEKTSDLVSQLPTTTYEHADKERVIVEKPQADEVEETKRASDAVSESKDPCVEEIEQTQRSLTMENLEEEIIEEEMPGRSRTVSTCNQSVEAIFQDEITRESPETGNSVDQLQELATPLLPEEEEHADKNPQKENLEDSFGRESVEEISLQKEGLRELEVSALAPKLSDVIQKEIPNEVLEVEGQTQQNAPEIKYMGSTTGSEEVMKLTRSINSSSQETLKEEEILDSESSNNKAGDFSITHSSGENLPKMQEQCEKTPILESKMIEKASESVSEVHYPEVVIKLEETEVKEEHLKTSVAEMKTEEIPHEKKIEANEIVKNEISNEEIAEEKQVAKDYQPESLDKETIRKSQQGDELKNEAEHEELSEGSKKGEASENIEKQIIDEARTVEHPPLVSFRDESVKDDLLEEAKEERNDKETDIKLDLVNQSDETALSEQAECSDIQLVKKDLNIADAHDDKEIVITKDDDLKPNVDVQPATRAAAEEASHQKEGDRTREVSESAPQEPVHERCNEETATAITDYSENIMEDKMHTHTPSELACKEQYVSEGLNLKDLEVSTNENGTSPFSETSWEEIPDKESVISEAERQHDLSSGEQTIAASMPTEEKGAKDEGEHTKDEEPIEFSARGSKGKLEEADIHSKTCHKDGEIQDQIDKLNASSQVQDSCMEISEKEANMDLAEANESTQDIKNLEKGSDETSQKLIPSEAEPNESTEVMVSSSKEEVQPVAKDLQPAVGSLESGNVSSIESGAGAKDLGGEKTMGDISEEPAVDPTPPGPAVSFSDLLQRSIKETLQAPGCLTEEKEQTVNKEDALAKEEEGSDVQEAKTLEDRDQEEERGEQKKDDPGSDAPIIIEASRDMNAKDGHKKSHNILSGVGSKVKHSIAKVKKAITGKSSHQKHSSPKGTATKVKEQK